MSFHPSLQVVFFMYLWSIDIDAVLTAMSCFTLLCEEAEIRCGADEVAVTQILPNYGVYWELAAASTVLTTGTCIVFLEWTTYVFLWGCEIQKLCLSVIFSPGKDDVREFP